MPSHPLGLLPGCLPLTATGCCTAHAAVRNRVKKLLKKLAHGDMPLSQLEKELHTFPLLERQLSFFTRTKRDDNFGWYILNEVRVVFSPMSFS